MAFFSFHWGDMYGSESKSSVLEYVKTFLPIGTLLLGALFQRWLGKRTEKEKDLLQLFNLNEDLKHIITATEPIEPVFREFSTAILADPFGENLLKRRFLIPDFNRVLDSDKKSIFSAFYQVYDDKKEGASDYRKAYNSVEFLKQLVDLLYNKYDTIIEDIYKEKVKFKDGLGVIRQKTADALSSIRNENRESYSALPQFSRINEAFLAYLNQLDIAHPLPFHVDQFLLPLRTILLDYREEPYAKDILNAIKQNLNLRAEIIQAATELGDLLAMNSKSLPGSIDSLRKITQTLEPKLFKVHKKG